MDTDNSIIHQSVNNSRIESSHRAFNRDNSNYSMQQIQLIQNTRGELSPQKISGNAVNRNANHVPSLLVHQNTNLNLLMSYTPTKGFVGSSNNNSDKIKQIDQLFDYVDRNSPVRASSRRIFQQVSRFSMAEADSIEDKEHIKQRLRLKFERAIKLEKEKRIKEKMIKVLQNTESRRFKNLTEHLLGVLNDRSVIPEMHIYQQNLQQQLQQHESQQTTATQKQKGYQQSCFYSQSCQSHQESEQNTKNGQKQLQMKYIDKDNYIQKSYIQYGKNHKKKQTLSKLLAEQINVLDMKISKIFRFKPFHPMNHYIFALQILECLCVMLDVFIYSLFCFFNYYDRDVFLVCNVASIVIEVASMFLSVNTAYYDQGMVVHDRTKIIARFRRTLLFSHILGLFTIIFQLSVQNNQLSTKIICLFLLTKYKIYIQNVEEIESRMNLTGNMIHVWSLLKLMGSALTLCHTVATLYFFLAYIEKSFMGEEITWVDKQNLTYSTPREQYVQSVYWAVSTMTLIGTKGDTEIETIFCLLTLMCTIGVFATILSQVSMVWEEMASKEKDYKKDRDTLNQFFSLHSLSHDLQGQLHNYLKYSFQGHKEKTSNVQFENLLEKKFPQAIQDTVRFERYSTKVKAFTLLTDNFSDKVVKQIINCVSEQYFMPHEIIFQRDVYNEPKLYLILSGEAELYQETGEIDSILVTLNEGDYFGQDTFFTDSSPFFSARSTQNSFTTVLSISRSSFLQIIQNTGTELDREKLAMMKEDIIFKGVSKMLDQNCYICGDLNHNEKQCNLINYSPNILNQIARLNYSEPQVRNEKFIRHREIERFNSKINLDILQDRYQTLICNPQLRKYLKILQEHQKKIQEKQELEDEENLSSFQSDDFSSEDSQSNNVTNFYEPHTLESSPKKLCSEENSPNQEISGRFFFNFKNDNIVYREEDERDSVLSQQSEREIQNQGLDNGKTGKINRQRTKSEIKQSKKPKNPSYFSKKHNANNIKHQQGKVSKFNGNNNRFEKQVSDQFISGGKGKQNIHFINNHKRNESYRNIVQQDEGYEIEEEFDVSEINNLQSFRSHYSSPKQSGCLITQERINQDCILEGSDQELNPQNSNEGRYKSNSQSSSCYQNNMQNSSRLGISHHSTESNNNNKNSSNYIDFREGKSIGLPMSTSNLNIQQPNVWSKSNLKYCNYRNKTNTYFRGKNHNETENSQEFEQQNNQNNIHINLQNDFDPMETSINTMITNLQEANKQQQHLKLQIHRNIKREDQNSPVNQSSSQMSIDNQFQRDQRPRKQSCFIRNFSGINQNSLTSPQNSIKSRKMSIFQAGKKGLNGISKRNSILITNNSNSFNPNNNLMYNKRKSSKDNLISVIALLLDQHSSQIQQFIKKQSQDLEEQIENNHNADLIQFTLVEMDIYYHIRTQEVYQQNTSTKEKVVLQEKFVQNNSNINSKMLQCSQLK